MYKIQTKSKGPDRSFELNTDFFNTFTASDVNTLNNSPDTREIDDYTFIATQSVRSRRVP